VGTAIGAAIEGTCDLLVRKLQFADFSTSRRALTKSLNNAGNALLYWRTMWPVPITVRRSLLPSSGGTESSGPVPQSIVESFMRIIRASWSYTATVERRGHHAH